MGGKNGKICIDKGDLMGLSASELKIARNEIYARHGKIFKDKILQEHFDKCSWYQKNNFLKQY